MKNLVLQATSIGGSGGHAAAVPSERFVASCHGVEHLVGKDLSLDSNRGWNEKEEGADNDIIMLFVKSENGGQLEVAAKVVCSSAREERSMFPTVHLKSQDFRRLLFMGQTHVRLLSLSYDEFGEDDSSTEDDSSRGETIQDMDLDKRRVYKESPPPAHKKSSNNMANMKKMVLQASCTGSSSPERFVVSWCQGVEHLVGDNLILRTSQGTETSSTLLLFFRGIGGAAPTPAARVVSSYANDNGPFPTINLPYQDFRRLLFMRQADVCLHELFYEDLDDDESKTGEESASHGGINSDMDEGRMGVDTHGFLQDSPPNKKSAAKAQDSSTPSDGGGGLSIPKKPPSFREEDGDSKPLATRTTPMDLDSKEDADEANVAKNPSDESKEGPLLSDFGENAASKKGSSWESNMNLSSPSPPSSQGSTSSSSGSDDLVVLLPPAKYAATSTSQEQGASGMKFTFGIQESRTMYNSADASGVEVVANDVGQLRMSPQKRSHGGDAVKNGNEEDSPFDESPASAATRGTEESPLSTSRGAFSHLADEVNPERTRRIDDFESSSSVPRGGHSPSSKEDLARAMTEKVSHGDHPLLLSLHSSSNHGVEAFGSNSRPTKEGAASIGGTQAATRSYAHVVAAGGGHSSAAASQRPVSANNGHGTSTSPPTEEATVVKQAAEPKKKEGFLSRVVNATASLMGVNSPEIKKATFKAPDDWGEYARLASGFHRSAMHDNTKKLISAVGSAEILLATNDCKMTMLTLAAYMCNLDCEIDRAALQTLIIERLATTSFSRNNGWMPGIKYQQRINPTPARPNMVWHEFFSLLAIDKKIPHGETDQFWLQVFSIWEHSGIFHRRKYDPVLWRKVGGTIDGHFFKRQRDRLVALIGLTRTNVLGAFLKGRLDDFTQFVLESSEEGAGRHVLLNGHAASHIVELVEQAVRTKDTSTSSLWGPLALILGLVQFPERAVAQDIMKKAFGSISFRSLHTFEYYDDAIQSIDSGFKFATTARALIQENLRDDLICSTPANSPRLDDVSMLLSTSTRQFLLEGIGKEALTRFTDKAMTSSAPFETKLRFLGDLYSFFSLDGQSSPSREIKAFIRRAISTAKEYSVNPIARLQIAFRVAAQYPSIFHCAIDGKHFLITLSKVLCAGEECQAVLRDPESLRPLLSENEVLGATSLLACLTHQIQDGLAAECRDFDRACHLFIGVLSGEAPTTHPLLSLPVRIFTASFWEWNPQSVKDLVAPPLHRLSSLQECFIIASKCVLTPEGSRKMQECHRSMEVVASEWSREYESEALTKRDLEFICRECYTSYWPKLSEICAVELPTFPQLRDKFQVLLELEAKMKVILQGTPDHSNVSLRAIFRAKMKVILQGTPDRSNVSLRAIFRGYSCMVEDPSSIGRLLTSYDWLLDAEEPQSGVSRRLEPELRHLREDVDDGNMFCSKHSIALDLCDYFLKNSSVLFRGSVVAAMATSPSLESLVLATDQAKGWVSRLLGSSATFEDIKCAVNKIHAAESTVKYEVSILQGCDNLELSEKCTQIFLAVAALAEAMEPLRRFVECCHQFKFAVTEDPRFQDLSNMVHRLSCDESGLMSAQECFSCSEHIYMVLQDDPSDPKPADVFSAFTDIRPTLNLMACLSVHSEVWTFIREMNWLGKEGLKSFYQQYENVTNVLLGSSASYEMSVLNALEPTVRLVSTVAVFDDEPKVAALLVSLRTHKAVSGFIGTADVVQVQTNLSQIRDWFTCGVDEVAQVHVTFDAVCRTGEYCLLPHTPDRESKVVCDAPDVLTLCYKSIESRRVLQAEELNSFIQHIGLVQHEHESTAASVSAFVEQHHTLVRASRNVVDMEALGYGESGKDSFSCRVGRLHIDRANELLSQSETALRQCQTWLGHIRSSRFVSLLFYNEELHELHRSLSRAAEVENDTATQIEHSLTSRLLRLTCGSKTRQDLLPVISSAISSRADESFRLESSWLVDVSDFLHSVHEALSAPWKRILDVINEKGRSQIVLHTMACKRDEYLRLSLRILREVYKERLPEPYEIFDGLVDGTSEKLAVFLERVSTFRSHTFTILHVESLEGKLLEVLLSFLSNPGIASDGIRLHLLQQEGTVLHASPWIRGERWEPDEHDVDHESAWRGLVVDQININRVTVVWSPRSGAGKTRFIQQKMSERRPNGGAESSRITVHERSTIESLTKDLVSKCSQATGCVHFNLTCLPNIIDDATEHWVECLNHFFFFLLVLRFVKTSDSALSFHLPSCWDVFIEVPNIGSGSMSADSVKAWVRRNVPVLLLCGNVISPPSRLDIDEESRRVCTYLRAFRNGTINRKFEPMQQRRIIFVLDKSGSMSGSALRMATDNALKIFDTHIQVGDILGVIMFNDAVQVQVPVQTVADVNQRLLLRQSLDGVRHHASGGTLMYAALRHAFASVQHVNDDIETWIVCLTDGQSHDNDDVVRAEVERSRENVHLTIIGVNLPQNYGHHMRVLCNKYGRREQACKGFFVPSGADIDSMNSAFETVSRSIPVSQTFELDGAVSDKDCHYYLDHYVPEFVDRNDALLMTLFVRFIYRRVKVFDENESFNYNEKYDSLGSTLMKAMLGEVRRLLSTNQSRDWVGRDHTQLIYDFSNKESPEFRLLCTAPDEMEASTRLALEELDLPGFSIPTNHELQKRSTLDRYLSQSLGIPLRNGRIACIDDNKFVLTLDFTMKLLSIHERVACRSPCVLEGETGVSKTALTQMYAILRNAVVDEQAKSLTQQHLEEIAQELVELGHPVPFGFDVSERLERALSEASEAVVTNETELARDLHKSMLEKCALRPSVFQVVPAEFSQAEEARSRVVLSFLEWFHSSALEHMFFDVNVDASLNEEDFVKCFVPIRRSAEKLLGSDALVVVFLDEFNTSSVLGLCKEIIIDHSLAGQDLESNIVVIAACNPSRKQVASKNLRERDLGREWAGGHYQVAELPSSIAKIKWSFGSLNRDQEKEFILQRLSICDGDPLQSYVQMSLTEYISESQEAMRRFAARNIRNTMVHEQGELGEASEVDRTVMERSRSVVSLRDIQRVFSLFHFFSTQLRISCISDVPDAEARRNAMLLSVATVYYLRLDGQSREEFLVAMQSLPAEQGKTTGLLHVLNNAMDEVISETEIPSGVAITRGLKENVFMTFVCTLSKTALIIVGPPGASKTLSVNIVADNCNGEDSASQFYRKHARLALFHYQCSKQSTSKELLAVFDKAIERQQRVDSTKHRCFVLMDEAGLPEEEKESLKVLHYLLEGHMSAKADVGFVAISNHVLDAAKTNRCVMLLREEPDEKDMLSIASGVLFDSRGNGHARAQHVAVEGELRPANSFALSLCQSYAAMLHDTEKLAWFDTFFGLRDLIHFLKAIRCNGRFEAATLEISLRDIVSAIERNFNGVALHHIRLIAEIFLTPLVPSKVTWSPAFLDGAFRDPVHVIRHALQSPNSVSSLANMARFKLIIDCSGDDSILRLLNASGMVDISKMFKLSRMPQDVALEELRLISGVKFAALQGKLAVLSQTESINESFYDLFNQRFQSVTGRDGGVDLYANIAVGGVSRRSLVRPEFDCVVHVTEADMPLMPAPFLNRFEKFRLSIHDVLRAGLSSLGEPLTTAFRKSRLGLAKVASLLCDSEMVGWVNDKQTLDSLYIGMLPTLPSSSDTEMQATREETETQNGCGDAEMLSRQGMEEYGNLVSAFIGALHNLSSLRPTIDDVHLAIESGIKYMPFDDVETLRAMSSLQTEALLQSFETPSEESTPVSRVFRIMLEMLTTRSAARRLLQLATPEALFASRDYIPECILQDYFVQEHFSLKRLVGTLLMRTEIDKKATLSLVYTRTSASIHSISSHNVIRNLSQEDPSSAERLRELVHDNLDELVVENLSVLKSEAMLNSAVDAFAKKDQKRVFVLLVDMGSAFATEKVNYARMLVDRYVSAIRGKSFVFLLHYSFSGRDGRCYPALFLGGWDHFFLDGIGSQQSLGIEYLIQAACMPRARRGEMTEEENITSRISHSALLLLPRILPHVASHKLFYPSQERGGRKSFVNQTNMLQNVLETRVGSLDMATILATKFAKMWAEKGLINSMTRATRGLLLGTTRLSLAMSLESVLVETFDAFVTTMMREQNQWRNLDLLLEGASDSRTLELYGLILNDVPVMPFEELILQTKSHATPLSPMADPRNESASVHFPFFRLVSSFIDECIEKVEQSIGEGHELGVVAAFPLDGMELFLKTTQVMQQLAGEDLTAQGRSPFGRAKPALTAISFVEEERELSEFSHFDSYMRHFFEWRFACCAHPLLVGRIERDIEGYGRPKNIVALHVAARTRSKELQTIASIVSTIDRTSLYHASVDESSPTVPYASTGEELFARLLDHFEETVFTDDVPISEWCPHFTRYLHQIPAMLGGKLVEDLREACRLRILCFFCILIDASASTQVHRAVTNVWKEKDSMTVNELVEALSLENLLAGGVGNLALQDLTIRHFFSPVWTSITLTFWDDDVSFLLDAISNGMLDEFNGQLLVTLLHQACFCGLQRVWSLSDSLASGRLSQLVPRISCDQVSTFSSDGKRTCLPHYVPDWLLRDGVDVFTGSDLRSSLTNYSHCFACPLSRVVFDLLFQLHVSEAENESSESLFVGLIRCMHEETSIGRLEQTRLSRSRNISSEKSLVGSPLGALALDIRLICFVAKVSHEVAIDNRAAVFSGVYASEASQLLEELMSLGHLRFQEFFFGIILRKRGEGTLAEVLRENGPLVSHMGWCKEWARGMPTQQDALVRSLREAENALAEALQDEDRKTQEFQLCPFCGQPFAVAQLNCGSFVCGRADYHNGQQAVHGCGQTFQLAAAQRYLPNEELLRPLRAAVEAERARYQEYETAATLLKGAREVHIPVASFGIQRGLSQSSLLPRSSFPSVEGEDERKTVALLDVLLDGSKRASQFTLLPDLIEFYMWLHFTFRYLVTRERAFHMKVSETMKEALLQRRFDSVTTNHVSSLWERVTRGVNKYLDAVDHKIAYNCQEIEVSFNRLEDASLVTLLSEGDHPTDGNDVLFLIINEIVDVYNVFSRRVAECIGSGVQKSAPLHPKFVATGCGGAMVLSAAVPLSSFDLSMLVSSFWNSNEHCYDLKRLGTALRREIGLVHLPPVISNPSECLRERFRFRDDSSRPLVDAPTSTSVFIGQDGECFANSQDYRLACDVRQSLVDNEMCVGDARIRRTLTDNFYSCDYNQLRLMLEGCRSLLCSVSMELIVFQSVDQVLRAVSSSDISCFCAEDALSSFGFPELKPAKAQLLTTLDAAQFEELARFLSYQLASEAHLFANLPLHMTDPLKPNDCEDIESRLESLIEDQGAAKVVGLIDEFTRDVLSFYESPIRDAAANSNRSLKGFLVEQNACDDSVDPVFALLPTRVSLHNYVSLRQHLHQCKLRFLSSEPVTTTNMRKHHIEPETIDLFTRPSRGRCWLWQDDELEAKDACMQVDEDHSTPYNENWSLWFESKHVEDDEDEDMSEVHVSRDEEHLDAAQCRNESAAVSDGINDGGSQDAENATQTMEIDEHDEKTAATDEGEQETKAVSARILQRWWRRQLLDVDRDAIVLDQDDYEHMFAFDEEDYYEDEDYPIYTAMPRDAGNGSALHRNEHHSTSNSLEDASSAAQLEVSDVIESTQHASTLVQTENGPSQSPSATEQMELSEQAQPMQIEMSQDTGQQSIPVSRALDSNSAGQRSLQEIRQYGNLEEEEAMRSWLNDNRLPQSVADELIELGARNLNDVMELVESDDELLEDTSIKPFDKAKLRKAVKKRAAAT